MTIHASSVCFAIILVVAGHQFLSERRRTLVLALLVAAGIAWLGQQGTLSYLGITAPNTASWASPDLAIAISLLLSVVKVPPAQRHLIISMRSARIAAAGSAIGVLLWLHRFLLLGIPLILGNSARLTTSASIGAKEAILTAVLSVIPIAVVLAANARPTVTLAPVLVNFVCVIGSASRLLIAACLVTAFAAHMSKQATATTAMNIARGLRQPAEFNQLQRPRTSEVTKRFIGRGHRRRSARTVAVLALAAALILLPLIYSLRTSGESSAANLADRSRAESGVSPLLLDVVGTGSYLSARNGAAVVTAVVGDGRPSPRGGYVAAGLAHTLAAYLRVPEGTVDPESYLTTDVFGLQASDVGTTAIPLAGAAYVDAGYLGAAVLGAIIIFGWDLLEKRFGMAASTWWAFGSALSAYGMYLTSVQFLSILAAFLVIWVSLPTSFTKSTSSYTGRRNSGLSNGVKTLNASSR
jgi:hypothetical protein